MLAKSILAALRVPGGERWTMSKNSVNSSPLQEDCRQEAGRMTYPDPGADLAPILPRHPRRYRPLVPVVMAFCVAIFAAEWSADHLLWAVGTIVILAGVCVGLALWYAG